MPERRRRFGPLPRFLTGAVAVALCTTAAIAALAIGAISTIAADLGKATIHSAAITAAKPGAPQTILVVGDDHDGPLVNTPNGRQRLLHADTFMLVHMDPNQGQTSIMSIPRDLDVTFRYHGALWADQKFNATYALGKASLVATVAKDIMPGLTINHIIDVNFSTFIGVVHAIGCVYVDVDRRYLNPGDPTYLPIDLQPGYQRLCANNALQYVRYRHGDSDFVRVARQQDFIRQAKEQVNPLDLVSKYDQIFKELHKSIRTDVQGPKEINDLLTLIASSLSKPIRDIHFQYQNADTLLPNGGAAVVATPAEIHASLAAFLTAPASGSPATSTSTTPATTRTVHHHHHHAAASKSTPGLTAVSSGVSTQATQLQPNVPFPVYVPGLQTLASTPNEFHAYTVADQQGAVHDGYRIDWYDGNNGGYYGIEGMNWTNPPLFAHPDQKRTIAGRDYMIVDDGSHIHDIGWVTGGHLYWISNTLLEDLSNDQMLAIARSAAPLSG